MKEVQEDREYKMTQEAIRRNRLKRKKAARKKMCRRILAVLGVVAVLTVTVLSLTVFFSVELITVSGKSPYSAAEIIRASGVKKGQNLWLTGQKAEETVPQKLPYIASLKVQRKLPAKVVLLVKTATVHHAYQTKEGYFLCDAEDKLLEHSDTLPKGVLCIVGSTAKKEKLGVPVSFKKPEKTILIQTLTTAMEEKNIAVNKMVLTDEMNLSFRVENRFTVRFGSSGNCAAKVAHLAQMVEKIDPSLQGTIDLSNWSVSNPRGIFTQK